MDDQGVVAWTSGLLDVSFVQGHERTPCVQGYDDLVVPSDGRGNRNLERVVIGHRDTVCFECLICLGCGIRSTKQSLAYLSAVKRR